MSGNLKKGRNGRGGTTNPDAIRVIALERVLHEQNIMLINLSAVVHSVHEQMDLSRSMEGQKLLHGTADILAKAGLMESITWIPKEEPN